MELEFLNELHEARMTRNSSDQAKLTYTDCCERLYLSMLSLELLRRFPGSLPTARGYARRTTSYGPFNYFRMTATDLYNFIYFVDGDEKALDKLKDPASAKMQRARTRPTIMAMNRYLYAVANNSAVNQSEFFVRLENAINIINSDYKSIRRNIFSYPGLSSKAKKETVTKLILAVRAKLRNSDIIEYVEKLVAVNDLEDYRVKDNEPTVSMPDVTAPSGTDLQYYRYIVGAKGLVGTKKFLDTAGAGKTVPAPFVQAYLPAIKMLDNIVKGGPGFIQMLRSLEKRAKSSRK